MLIESLSLSNVHVAAEIAALPLGIRGYGPVKASAAKLAKRKEESLLARFVQDREAQEAVF